MHKSLRAFLMVAGALWFCSGVARAGLIANGGFESGDFSNWTVTGAFTIENSSAYAGAPSAGFFGPTAFATDVPDHLSQFITTLPGAYYDLSYYLRNDNAFAPNDPDNPVTNSFSAYWDGALIPSSALNDVVASDYTLYTFPSLQASGPTTQVEFLFGHSYVDRGGGGCIIAPPGEWQIDNISAQSSSQSQSSTPEPSSIALALLAAGGLALLNFKRK